ncbi:hypothetical protein KBD34_00355 [Patescibacteria group bacterium]|nr:hypothetical protein [Patescibacteria group bacterium]
MRSLVLFMVAVLGCVTPQADNSQSASSSTPTRTGLAGPTRHYIPGNTAADDLPIAPPGVNRITLHTSSPSAWRLTVCNGPHDGPNLTFARATMRNGESVETSIEVQEVVVIQVMGQEPDRSPGETLPVENTSIEVRRPDGTSQNLRHYQTVPGFPLWYIFR